MEEEGLLTRLTSGNQLEAEKAFTRLAEIVRPRIIRHLARMNCGSALREDIAQDVLLKLWEKRDDFQYRGVDRFYTWIYLAAKRRYIDSIREQIVDNDPSIHASSFEFPTDVSELEAILHCSNVLWLELPKEASNDEHFRMLRAAQHFYLDKQPWQRVIRLLGGGVSESTLNRWLDDAGVLRYLTFHQVYYPGGRLLWHFVFPDLPYNEDACYDLIISSQSKAPGTDPPVGTSWADIRILFLRFCCCIATDEITEHAGCKISHSEVSAVIDRCLEHEPFSIQMRALLRAISRPANGKPAVIGSRGLWQRLAFQYRYFDDLPHKDIHERVSPAADVAGYQEFTLGALNVWLSNRRLIDQIRKCVEAREQ